jgi:N-acetylmuramoyl-L-alanine amidase
MIHAWRNGTMAGIIFALLLALGVGQEAFAQTPAKTAAKPDSARCDRAAFRIVLDVGHTAEEPGATSARGVPEYEFNLRLAKVIAQTLKDAGFARTDLLVTAGPTIAGLVKRVAYANSSPADLFLSIHHDAVPDKFLANWEYDGAEHHFSDRFKGHSLFVSNNNGNYRASLLFGHLLGDEMKARGLHYTPHYTQAFMGRKQRELVDADAGVYRFDQLFVLRETHMPAVLLEAGSILNRDEELELSKPERQSLTAAAVTDAVVQFCALRSPRAPTQTAGGARGPQALKFVRPAAAAQQVSGARHQ